MEDRQWLILYVVVCLEVGLFLTLVPWSAVWERNFFLDAYPSLRPILLAPAVRGAVAGLGLANVYMGFQEIVSRRRSITRKQSAVSAHSRESARDPAAEVSKEAGPVEAETLAATEERS